MAEVLLRGADTFVFILKILMIKWTIKVVIIFLFIIKVSIRTNFSYTLYSENIRKHYISVVNLPQFLKLICYDCMMLAIFKKKFLSLYH